MAKDKGSYGEIVSAWLDDPTNMEKADLVELNEPGYTRTRCVATQLAGGHAPNALPQKAEAIVNCRIFPGVKTADVQAELQAIAGKEVKVELAFGGDWSEPSPMRDDVRRRLSRRGREAISRNGYRPVDVGWCNRRDVHSCGGIPTYGVGGLWSYIGEQTGSHGLNERVVSKAFHDQIDIWEEMLFDCSRVDVRE